MESWEVPKGSFHVSAAEAGPPDDRDAADVAPSQRAERVPGRLGVGICCQRGQGPPGASPAGEVSQVHGGSAVSRALDCGWSLVRPLHLQHRRRGGWSPWPRSLEVLTQVGSGFFREGSKQKPNLTPKHSDPEDTHYKIPGPGGAVTVTAVIKDLPGLCESIL